MNHKKPKTKPALKYKDYMKKHPNQFKEHLRKAEGGYSLRAMRKHEDDLKNN